MSISEISMWVLIIILLGPITLALCGLFFLAGLTCLGFVIGEISELIFGKSNL